MKKVFFSDKSFLFHLRIFDSFLSLLGRCSHLSPGDTVKNSLAQHSEMFPVSLSLSHHNIGASIVLCCTHCCLPHQLVFLS